MRLRQRLAGRTDPGATAGRTGPAGLRARSELVMRVGFQAGADLDARIVRADLGRQRRRRVAQLAGLDTAIGLYQPGSKGSEGTVADEGP